MERVFAWFDGDTPGASAGKIRAFRVIFATVIATEYWTKALRDSEFLDSLDWDAVLLASLPALAVFHGR